MTTPRFRVAICGGGIGGLTLALVLHKYAPDILVDLYEAHSTFSEVGAGISVWRRTWHVFKQLGIDESLAKAAVTPPVDEIRPGFVLRKGDQEEPGFNFHQMLIPCGSITLHRADLLQALTENLPDGFRSHFNKRLITYEQSTDGSIVLCFSDGSHAKADILVGADGIKSATRATMYQKLACEAEESDPIRAERFRNFIQARWTGTYAYRSLIPAELLNRVYPGHQACLHPMIYFGRNKHIVSYPISQGRLVNLVPFVTISETDGVPLPGPAVVDVSKEEVLGHFSGWEPEARVLLECMEQPSRWAISHIRGLPQYVHSRVALLGDAAHAMTTHIGAGAGQSIEDAYILGRILASNVVDYSGLDNALSIFERVRLPIGNAFVDRAYTTGFMYEFKWRPNGGIKQNLPRAHVQEDSEDHPDFVVTSEHLSPSQKIDSILRRDGIDRSYLESLVRAIYKQWEVQWITTPDVDWRKAESFIRNEFRVVQARL